VEPSLQLTELQVQLASTFFALDAAEGYLVAGGAGLLAAALIDRPTEDLDLFAADPVTSVTSAKEAYLQALREHGCLVVLIDDEPTFCRMVVGRDGSETLVDLAIDSPPTEPPTMTILGPTLAPLELATRKLLALFGRAEARDFADLYVLCRQFDRTTLIEQAHRADADFDLGVLAQVMNSLARFDDSGIPAAAGSVPALRTFFAEWADSLT
jgi:hypothetical protein